MVSLLFLVPLGFVAFRYGRRVTLQALFVAVTLNAVLVLGTALGRTFPPQGIFWDIFYFTVMAFLFVWVCAPPPALPHRVCGTIRLTAGAAVASLLLMGMFFRAAASPAFLDHLSAILAPALSQQGAAGANVVQNAILADLTPEVVLSFITSTMLRGGALIFAVFLFFACRQLAFLLARLFKPLGNKFAQGRPEDTLAFFRVNPAVIWVLSGALLLLVMTSRANLVLPEIILWNVLIICGILYLAQGMGILQFFLARPTVTPVIKLLLCVLFFALLFSPGINVVLFGGVVLLGIAENWLPLRVSKINGPPSTPGAGNTGS